MPPASGVSGSVVPVPPKPSAQRNLHEQSPSDDVMYLTTVLPSAEASVAAMERVCGD